MSESAGQILLFFAISIANVWMFSSRLKESSTRHLLYPQHSPTSKSDANSLTMFLLGSLDAWCTISTRYSYLWNTNPERSQHEFKNAQVHKWTEKWKTKRTLTSQADRQTAPETQTNNFLAQRHCHPEYKKGKSMDYSTQWWIIPLSEQRFMSVCHICTANKPDRTNRTWNDHWHACNLMRTG